MNSFEHALFDFPKSFIFDFTQIWEASDKFEQKSFDLKASKNWVEDSRHQYYSHNTKKCL